MYKSSSQNEHTGFESEKKSGWMKGEKQLLCYVGDQVKGEKQSGQMIGEKQSGQAQSHDCYAMPLVR